MYRFLLDIIILANAVFDRTKNRKVNAFLYVSSSTKSHYNTGTLTYVTVWDVVSCYSERYSIHTAHPHGRKSFFRIPQFQQCHL